MNLMQTLDHASRGLRTLTQSVERLAFATIAARRQTARGRRDISRGLRITTTFVGAAARAIDVLTASLAGLGALRAGSPGAANDRALADLVKRGQAPELVEALKKAMG